MAQAGVTVQLAIPDIYKILCPKCKKKLKMLIRQQITNQTVDRLVGESVKGGD